MSLINQESRHDNSYWQGIYDNIPCYIFSFDSEGLINRVNNLLLEKLGYKREEVEGRLRSDALFNVGSRIFFQTHFHPMVKIRKSVDEIFLSLQHKNGASIPVLLNISISEVNGKVETHCAGVQIAARNKLEKDISDAKKTAEQALLENRELVDLKIELQSSKRMLEQKLQRIIQVSSEHKQINAILSHDLQEPLRKLSLFSNLLTTNVYDKSQEEKYLNKINELTTRVRNLVQGMQRYHAIDDESISMTNFKIETAIERALKILSYEQRQLAIGNITCVSSTFVDGDFELLSNVLSQLIDNSIKFRSSIDISIDIDVSEVRQNVFQQMENKFSYEPFSRIILRDNGIGFDEANSTRVFDLFRKGQSGEDGLGIGLAYCRKIISLHNGSIKAESKNGTGATITIFLPKVDSSIS